MKTKSVMPAIQLVPKPLTRILSLRARYRFSSPRGALASPRDCDASLMGGYYDQNEDSSCKRDDGVGRLLTVQRAACKVLL
jgi:hypothetical protein